MQGKVIRTKSVEYMPFFLSLVNFLNGCCWTAYALIKFDIYITVCTYTYTLEIRSRKPSQTYNQELLSAD